MEKLRDSRFEVLRIFAISIIVLYHFGQHTAAEWLEPLSVNQIFYCLYHIGGKLGVDLFVLITGYFSIRSTFRLKKIVDLGMQVLFYTLLFLAVYLVCIGLHVVPFSVKMVIRSVFPVTFNAYWFVTAYIGMFLFSPFINMLVARLSMRQYLFVLAVGSVVFTLIPTFCVQRQLVNDLLFFIYLYLLGGFIRLYWDKLDKKFSAGFLRGSVAVMTILLWLSAVALTVVAQHVNAAKGHEYYFHFEYSTLILLLALTIFMSVAKQKPYESKAVNQIAKTTFGVYLIQSNPIVATYFLWEWLAGFELYKQPLWGLYAVLIAAGIVVVSMVIDKGRLLLFQHIKPTKIYQHCDKLENYFELSSQK